MSDQDTHPSKFYELRSIYKYYIDSYNALYRLKTENEKELNKIYKMIKTELIDSKIYPPKKIIEDILYIIPYNNRYAKSYLSLAKLLYDNYQVKETIHVPLPIRYLFYREYGIKLNKSDDFEKNKFENLDFLSEDTIYRVIMNNELERFISFTERKGFNKNQTLRSELYPIYKDFSLLELCCYYGAVDCFKFLRTKFNSQTTPNCIYLSFLGGNPEIMSECLKLAQIPDLISYGKLWLSQSMMHAIISHNIDFVTFLMNEHNIEINLYWCGSYKNLESFLVYFDQTNDINACFVFSTMFDIGCPKVRLAQRSI
ncbi:hypothetical protein TVAG_455500 [Trichomonas vaginalis G3]|uniref:DUF3447 domain-containing protein n=1 Tax=Trichomonas vaginalis (strain ATCC PRA-98 / G3) TaxID=412133 RepID=A2FW89_TRIV3|nr:hypothetical protein TVAG_455500 [Trichomonas vaginalis G3]|eukprot:XP_001303752.1 hypothetical protein [Trichomonas vaginalis G3]